MDMKKIGVAVATLGLLFGTAVAALGSNARTASICAPRHASAQDSGKSTQRAKTYTGTIAKDGDAFVLKEDGGKTPYLLDDQEEAGKFQGKRVKVTGTLNEANNLIHIQSIVEVSA